MEHLTAEHLLAIKRSLQESAAKYNDHLPRLADGEIMRVDRKHFEFSRSALKFEELGKYNFSWGVRIPPDDAAADEGE